jgi:large subunit ribosomal protein L15
MKYNELTIKKAKQPNRVGRGISAGRGKTAGRGTKGQGARKSSIKHGFSGGQTPLHMQLPKLRGFKSKRRQVEAVYTGQIEAIKKETIDSEALAKAGLVSSAYVKVKLITNGELKSKKAVKVQAVSASAREMVEKAGGSVEIVAQLARPAKKPAQVKE